MTGCSIPDCDRPFYARTWCKLHYRRWWNHGDPTVVLVPSEARVYTRRSNADRFWSNVDKTGDCWLWTGSQDNRGYGQFQPYQSGLVKAHRWAYETEVGPIPEGLVLDHLCRVRNCVRPDHLEPVTLAENNRRGIGFAGQKSRQTHCIRGHEFTQENTYYRAKTGTRSCRDCHRQATAARRAKQLESTRGTDAA